MSKRCRLFFALEPSEVVRNQVSVVQRSLSADGRAVDPAQFHVTLAFLGMQPADVIPRLQSMASGLILRPCTIVLDRFGRFRHAGVLWLGSHTVPTELEAFHHSLLDGLEQAGIDRDRKPWEMHLTLYRRLRKLPPIMEPVPVMWPLDGFSLIESVSVKGGVEYHRRGQWNCSI